MRKNTISSRQQFEQYKTELLARYGNRIIRGNHTMGRQELNAWWWMREIDILWETPVPLASAL